MPDLTLASGVVEVVAPAVPVFEVAAPPSFDTTVEILPVPGPQGPAGGSTFTATAGQTLSGHRIVRATTVGTVVYASNTTPGDGPADVFLTLGAADTGADVTLHAFGRVTDPSWSWTQGPIWLTGNGVLSQTAPTSGFARQVATADGPTALFFNPRPAIVLA